jgi:hypothetical protein
MRRVIVKRSQNNRKRHWKKKVAKATAQQIDDRCLIKSDNKVIVSNCNATTEGLAKQLSIHFIKIKMQSQRVNKRGKVTATRFQSFRSV